MNTRAIRLYGKNDLRLEEFALPAMGEDEILAHIITDSICMSSYKATIQGPEHKRVPNDVAQNPVIIGHEFCGVILDVGAKWRHQFTPGQKFTIQPALNDPANPYAAPGYSFQYIGGAATHILIPNIVMEQGCLLPYEGDAFYYGSLSEPVSCIVGTYHAQYHTRAGQYIHDMGIKEGGRLALLAAAGPMGLGAIDYAIHCDRRPGFLMVTDIDEARLSYAASIYTVEEAAKHGVKLLYVNTRNLEDPVAHCRELAGGGFDDVMVFAPVKPVVEMGDRLLAHDGCLNFFAGPSDPAFSANFNFYNVHYLSTHVVGTSGGNTQDLLESLDMMAAGKLNPSSMVTHIGGLDCVPETVKTLPHIPGGKKLIYTNIDMELTAIADFAKKGESDPLFAQLADIVAQNNGLWCPAAEKCLLERLK